MHVPHHITIAGDGGRERPQAYDGGDYAYKMNVPERILVAGGDEIRGDRAPPSEVMRDRMKIDYPSVELASPPDTLTLDKTNYPEIVSEEPVSRKTPVQDVSLTLNSIAVDENPLRELKLMRRQVGRLSTRLYQLEDDYERKKMRETLLWSYIFGLTGLVMVLFFKKRIQN